MQLKTFFAAALAAGAASAQSMNLTAALASNSDLSALAGILNRYPDLAADIANRTNITLLAPNNNAINSLLNVTGVSLSNASSSDIAALLNYHVLQGVYYADNITSTPSFVPTYLNDTAYSTVTGGQVVECISMDDNVMFYSGLRNNASVVTPDVNFTSGVVHVIDSVLTIPLNASTTALIAGLTDLVGALIAADLVSTLDGASDLTILAPTNDAFSAIGSALGNITSQQLASILEYHIINGTVAYSTGVATTNVTSFQGTNLTVSVQNGSVFVNQARVVVADVLVSEGVVHVIDSVLNPNDTSIAPDTSNTTPVDAFPGATSSSVGLTSGVTTTTQTPGPGLTSQNPSPNSGYTTTPSSLGENPANTAIASSSSGIAAMPMKTGAVGAAALFGAGAFIANL